MSFEISAVLWDVSCDCPGCPGCDHGGYNIIYCLRTELAWGDGGDLDGWMVGGTVVRGEYELDDDPSRGGPETICPQCAPHHPDWEES